MKTNKMKKNISKILEENVGDSAENLASLISQECKSPKLYEYILDFLVIGDRVFDQEQMVDYILAMLEVNDEGIYFLD